MFTKLHEAAQQLNRVIAGKPIQIRQALVCVLAGGHLLIEDIPGVGKTTLAHALATTLGMQMNRLQFTSDLMPADVIGISVYEREKNSFMFHPGPIFTQVLLADEINRATPKTQSALLEAMEEHQVTAEGTTHPLPEPFFVLATQNPLHQVGTFPLPESQLDRFLMCIALGYPDTAAERALLMGDDRRTMLQHLPQCMHADELIAAQRAIKKIHCSEALLDYLQKLLLETRRSGMFTAGLSPRAGIALLQASRAWAALEGRDHVIPEDLQAIFISVAAHRLHPLLSNSGNTLSSQVLLDKLIKQIDIAS